MARKRGSGKGLVIGKQQMDISMNAFHLNKALRYADLQTLVLWQSRSAALAPLPQAVRLILPVSGYRQRYAEQWHNMFRLRWQEY